ncbi:hypothetical protein SDC9_161689 [bioreactor metagenome]|uniref:Uncharacterized protein n=1 Tax=bioreactor metagenome TaxID=1076179 RepID=A0A645FLD5_9ZZZZ
MGAYIPSQLFKLVFKKGCDALDTRNISGSAIYIDQIFQIFKELLFIKKLHYIEHPFELIFDFINIA